MIALPTTFLAKALKEKNREWLEGSVGQGIIALFPGIQQIANPLLHFLAWFESYNVFLFHHHFIAGPWVPGLAGRTAFDFENAEIPQFNPLFLD